MMDYRDAPHSHLGTNTTTQMLLKRSRSGNTSPNITQGFLGSVMTTILQPPWAGKVSPTTPLPFLAYCAKCRGVTDMERCTRGFERLTPDF